MSELADDPGVKYEKGVSPVLIWIEHPSADYYVCEQDSCGGESGYAHSMSAVPNPMYPLPISSTFRHATSEWNQDKDRCHRNKNPDRIRCKQDRAPRRVPTEPGLDTEKQGRDRVPDRHQLSKHESRMA